MGITRSEVVFRYPSCWLTLLAPPGQTVVNSTVPMWLHPTSSWDRLWLPAKRAKALNTIAKFSCSSCCAMIVMYLNLQPVGSIWENVLVDLLVLLKQKITCAAARYPVCCNRILLLMLSVMQISYFSARFSCSSWSDVFMLSQIELKVEQARDVISA